MTKFPDISLTLVKWLKFPDIFSKFPDNSLTWRKFCFSLTFPRHVATLFMHSSGSQMIVSCFIFIRIISIMFFSTGYTQHKRYYACHNMTMGDLSGCFRTFITVFAFAVLLPTY